MNLPGVSGLHWPIWSFLLFSREGAAQETRLDWEEQDGARTWNSVPHASNHHRLYLWGTLFPFSQLCRVFVEAYELLHLLSTRCTAPACWLWRTLS